MFRIRLAFEAIFRKSATLQDVNPEETETDSVNVAEEVTTRSATIIPSSPRASKKVQLVRL